MQLAGKNRAGGTGGREIHWPWARRRTWWNANALAGHLPNLDVYAEQADDSRICKEEIKSGVFKSEILMRIGNQHKRVFKKGVPIIIS